MSQSELPEKMGYSSTSSVNAWTQGSGYPSADSLPQLAGVLTVSLDWIFGLTESPEPPKAKELRIDLPAPLRTAAEQIVASEGYSDIEELIRALIREKTGVGRISSVSPRVRTAALQLVELAAQTISVGGKPGSGPLLAPEHQLVPSIQE